MRVRFTKMQGLGNDFVILEALSRPLSLSAGQVRHLADRRLGIGCDQLLVVGPATGPHADFRYGIYNADGSDAEQCGNGVRCIARYLHDSGMTPKRELRLESAAGAIETRLEPDGTVRVEMGVPRLEPGQIPFQAAARAPVYDLEVGAQVVSISAVSMGNPHAVLVVDEVDRAPVDLLGPAIESHPRFPQRANVGFLQVVDPTHARLRVFERGAGETRACGTGACAAVVAGRLRNLLAEQVTVGLPGGELVVSWAGEGMSVRMTGPAVWVFEGHTEL